MSDDIYVNYSYSDLKNLIDRSDTPNQSIMANGALLKSWSNLISVTSKCGHFRKLLTDTCQVKISVDGKLSGNNVDEIVNPESEKSIEELLQEETPEDPKASLFGPDENAQYMGDGYFIVRSQAGFRKALKSVGWSRGHIVDSFPKEYPSLVNLSTGYRGYGYVKVNCISVKHCLAFLTAEVKR